MKYIGYVDTPIGRMLMASDGKELTGLWFEGQKNYACGLQSDAEEKELEIFRECREWLDIYFSGKEPEFTPALKLTGTDFQMDVWEELLKIPYGYTVTYGYIAREICKKRGTAQMSARAVGSAIGKNKISIILPCHRVLGADGGEVGYAAGAERKIYLLNLENTKRY